jgi:ribosomal protein S18 acetylase RimI-like enzyme
MGEYVAAIWGWDEEVQRDLHESGFDAARTQIITVEGIDVGLLVVERRRDEIYLGRIEIHPEQQGRGIGGHLIQALQRAAQQRGRPVVLDVLAVNRRAYALYRRLGFEEVARHGENDIKITMRWDFREVVP